MTTDEQTAMMRALFDLHQAIAVLSLAPMMVAAIPLGQASMEQLVALTEKVQRHLDDSLKNLGSATVSMDAASNERES